MSSILVLEQEPDYMERISGALGAEGWRVRIVQEPSQALQVAASDAPDLVIVSAAVAGAAAVAIAFARSTGGPGVLGLLPTAAEAPGFTADEVLAKPFTDQDLRATVRRAVEARRAAVVAAPRPARGEVRLTSHDIFGDVLAEVEGAPQEASAGAAPRRPAACAARPGAASPAGAGGPARRPQAPRSAPSPGAT